MRLRRGELFRLGIISDWFASVDEEEGIGFKFFEIS
jgi:hypothetical protein